MTAGISLALSGSNVTGDSPFSCALRLAAGEVFASAPAGGRGDLAALVADLCARHRVRPEQIAELRIDLGPGSYTGLRVAVTFVRFLQRFGDANVLAVDSLTLLAASAREVAPPPTRLLPLLDARRGRFHLGVLSPTRDGGLAMLQPPQALPLPAVLAAVRPGDLCVVPAAVETQVGAELRAAGAALHRASGITAERLFDAGLPFVPSTRQDLEPRYLMGSYAED
ncbi:MAG TPA: tRNA (adenosine(37)-N6)-threonylcarbamoyltransferase complex dimerization subunit type 1 TsaB [Planctomycetota bacterium]|nr:tRNA (adenosine(37)-N6)-threonylcarbamoyltransferase complex dimerization subunit type 1 TsaB [Planctomycetota bacterium]